MYVSLPALLFLPGGLLKPQYHLWEVEQDPWPAAEIILGCSQPGRGKPCLDCFNHFFDGDALKDPILLRVWGLVLDITNLLTEFIPHFTLSTFMAAAASSAFLIKYLIVDIYFFFNCISFLFAQTIG